MAGLTQLITTASEADDWYINLVEDGNSDAQWSLVGDGRHNPVWELLTGASVHITDLGQGDLPATPVPTDKFGQPLLMKLYYYTRYMQYDEYSMPTGFGPWGLNTLTSDVFYIRPNASFNIDDISAIYLNRDNVISFTINEITPGSLFPVIRYMGDSEVEIARVPTDDDYHWYANSNGYMPPGSNAKIRISDAYFPDDIYTETSLVSVQGLWVTLPNSGTGDSNNGQTSQRSIGVEEDFTIEWQSASVSGNVDLLLDLDGDISTIANNIANSLSYDWTAPNTTATNAKIIVRSHNDHSIYDSSDYFTIRDNKLQLTISTSLLTAGNSFNITWDTFGSVPNITLEYREKNGTSYASPTFNATSTIATNIANTGSYSWTVSDIDSGYINGKGRIYLFDASDSSNFSIWPFGGDLAISGTPRVRLAQNDGFYFLALPTNIITGQTLASAVKVSHSFTGNVDILASTDNGSTYPVTLYNNITTNSTPSLDFDPSYNKIKIRSHSSPSTIFYEQAFVQSDIVVNYYAKVSNINLGPLVVGRIPNISISTRYSISRVDVLLSTDNGSTYPTTIINDLNVTAIGNNIRQVSTTWTVPNSPSSQCKLKIRDHNNTSNFVETETFTIQSSTSINVQDFTTVGNDGEDFFYTAGSSLGISFAVFKTTFGTDNVDIYLSTDGGDTYPITAVTNHNVNLNASASYIFVIPNIEPTTGAKIKVALTSNNSIFGVSNTFTIKSSYPTITAPADNSNLTIGDTVKITFDHYDLLGNASLFEIFNDEVDTNNTYRYYARIDILSNRGSYGASDWIVQGFPDADAKIFVSSNDINTKQNDIVNVNISASPETAAPEIATNNTLPVVYHQKHKVISSNFLEVTDEDNTASELIFTITEVPARGLLFKNTVVLNASDTFTQDDIDNGLINYSHRSNTVAPTDEFKFTVTDGDNTTEETTFNIEISNPTLFSKVIGKLLNFKV